MGLRQWIRIQIKTWSRHQVVGDQIPSPALRPSRPRRAKVKDPMTMSQHYSNRCDVKCSGKHPLTHSPVSHPPIHSPVSPVSRLERYVIHPWTHREVDPTL